MKHKLFRLIFVTIIALLFPLRPAQAVTGGLDTTFDSDGKVLTSTAGFDEARSLAVQSDGKIVVVGSAFNGSFFDMAIARYLANGSLDTSFDTDGLKTIDFAGQDDLANSVAIQSNGKIVVAGSSALANNGPSRFAIVRLNSDGSFDTSFDSDGKAISSSTSIDEAAHSLVIDSNGRLILGGYRYISPRANGTSGYDFTLMRFKANGNIDTAFGTSGTTSTYFGTTIANTIINSISLQSDGKIIAVGEAQKPSDIDLAVARYNTDGSLDNTFGTSGSTTLDIAVDSFQALNNLAIQTDDKIIVGGFLNSDFALARLLTNGALDTTFDADGIVTTDFGSLDEGIRGIAVQTDGKILAGGVSATDFALARYNSNGTLDSSFGQVGKTTTDFGGFDIVNDITTQSDGRINIAGTSNHDFVLGRFMHDAYETLTQTVSAGDTVTTDSELNGATASDPIETTLTSPLAGTLSIEESTATVGLTSGYTFLGGKIVVTAPTATALTPLILVFQIDSSLIPAGQTKDTIQIFRNGVLVPACTGAIGVALPDPCVSERVLLADSDVKITVLTSTASSWDVGVANATSPTYCDHSQATDNASGTAEEKANPISALGC